MANLQVFILAAQKIKGWKDDISDNLLTKKAPNGERILDMNLKLLIHNKISAKNINIICGYGYSSLKKEYSKYNCLYSPNWEKNNVGGSVGFALNFWNQQNVLFIYGDTLFNNSVFKEVLKHKNRNIIVSAKPKPSSLNIEKISDIITQGSSKQFTGLTLLNITTVEYLKLVLQKNIKKNQKIRFSAILKNLIKEHPKTDFKVVDASGMWTEIDSKDEFTKFLFGSKAETLQRISPYIKKSHILTQIHFNYKEWLENKSEILTDIKKIKSSRIIVRSSSLDEDSWESSNAGAYLSIKDVKPNNEKIVSYSIDKVFNSYSSTKLNNQVLIQPFIKKSKINGVIFTRTLEKGLPYYTISYDSTLFKTDTITSGNSNDINTVNIYRNTNTTKLKSLYKKLINATKEIEQLFNYTSLDLEFIIDEKDKINFVQVRPIISSSKLIDDDYFDTNINQVKKFLNYQFRKKDHISGDSTILSDMTDWNPAEMIGTNPKPLSLSLYEILITDSVWRESRALLGYFNPKYEKLMLTISNHPYIDVRNSLNSLTPENISKALRDKLINFYLYKLSKDLKLHDKVEFSIAITCHTLDFKKQSDELVKFGFNKHEINELDDSLKIITDNIIKQKNYPIKKLLDKTYLLDSYRSKIISKKIDLESVPEIISNLINECKVNGTMPFSILARYAFIGTSFLNSLVTNKIISIKAKMGFLSSIDTVATDLYESSMKIYDNKQNLELFLKNFGHLRPNTYDIETPSYKENFSAYFPKKIKNEYNKESKSFSFSHDEFKQIDKQLGEYYFNSKELIEFIQESIKAREYSKYMFTKTLSLILDLVKQYGDYIGKSRSEMSYLDINEILTLSNNAALVKNEDYISDKIIINTNSYQKSLDIITPDILTKSYDLDIISKDERRPNFVTSKIVIGEKVILDKSVDTPNLKDKILMIEGADPGYDWIFLHGIKGLITKYGGAASHMTIRCAEFGLPAAIGCGEKIFDQLRDGKKIKLDCEKMNILKIE